MILLAGLRNSPIRRPDASPSSDAPVTPVSPAADTETLVSDLSIKKLVSPVTICQLDMAFYDSSVYR